MMTIKRLLYTLLCIALTCSTLLGQRTLTGEAARKLIPFAQTIRTSDISNIPTHISFNEGQEIGIAVLFKFLRKTYKLSNDYDFVLLNEHTDDKGLVHYRYQQTYHNKPIETGVLLLHVKNDLVTAINGQLFNSISAGTNASHSENNALSAALDYVDAETYKWQIPAEEAHLKQESGNPNATYFPSGELVYIQPNLKTKTLKLAYKFSIYAHKPISKADIYVDANTNQVIFTNKIIKHIDVLGTATTGYSGVRTITTDSVSANNYRLRETGRGNGIETYDMNNNDVYGASVDFTDTDNNWNNINVTLDQYATDAHWGAEVTYDYYDLQHNRNSIDGAGFALKSYVHYNDGVNTGFNNAFWDGQRMTYGDGNGTTTSPLTALDIAGHEITHGLTNFTADLIYQDESGALNESFSDIFGTCVENYGRPSNWNWTLGEDIGITIRSMSNPNTYGDPDTYQGTNWVLPGGPGNGGVHTNSGVQNFWFYLLTDGGSGTNDNGDTYNVTGQGFSVASQIAFRNLTVYLTPSSNFLDARYYAIQSAIDLFGACSPEVEATTNAWYAVGVGSAYVPFALADFTAQDTVFCSAPALVNFQNQSINGASFSWDFGDGSPLATGLNPSHNYTSTGNYDVTLAVDGGICGVDTLTLDNFVTIDSTLPCLITLPANGTASTQTACNGTLFDSGGDAGSYGNLEDSQITIAPLGADSVRLDFISFAIEAGVGPTCTYDYINIYDGNSTTAPLLATYCNNNPPPASITSTTGAVTIEFHSDISVTLSGFEIDWNCYLASLAPVANFESLDTITCSGSVQFTDLSTNGPTGWTWYFGDNNTSSLQNPIHNYTASGNYTVSLVAENSTGTDSISFVNYVDVDLLAAPPALSDSICENQTTDITSVGVGVPRWYSAVTGGTPLFEGPTFTTPPLSTSTTYFVSDFQAGPISQVGAPSSAIGSGGFFSGDQHLIFNCSQASTLKSVQVLSGSDGNRTIELRNSSGTVLETVTVNIPASTSGQLVTVVLDMPIPIGNNLALGTAAGSSPDLYRNINGATYPYTAANNSVVITGTSASLPDAYYYFYNWEVEGAGCESDRSPVDISVFPDFDLSITNAPVVACTYQTAVPLSANFPGGTWSAGCTNCINATTGVFQPNQAGVGGWTISYTTTNNCPKTVTANISVETCLGIDENTAIETSIFPNPSNSIVNIAFNSDAVENIVMTDVSGKVILKLTANQNKLEVDASVLENGLYFFNFLNARGESLSVEKFIKF